MSRRLPAGQIGAALALGLLLALGAAILPGPQPACAQPSAGACATKSVILQDGATANANGNDAHVAGFAFLGLQVYHPTAGATPSFTVNFEQSITGSHYFAAFCQHVAAAILHNTTTTSSLWRCNVTGTRVFRARISTYSGSGSISVVGNASACGEL